MLKNRSSSLDVIEEGIKPVESAPESSLGWLRRTSKSSGKNRAWRMTPKTRSDWENWSDFYKNIKKIIAVCTEW